MSQVSTKPSPRPCRHTTLLPAGPAGRPGFILFALALGCLLAGLVWAPQAAAGVSEYVLDPAIRHQVMDNFGANDAWTISRIGAEWSDAGKNALADLLFSTNQGIGLSCWRFNLTAGLNHATIHNPWRTGPSFETAPDQWDWTRLPGQRWFLAAARARGVNQFIATVYSPPARLTRDGLSNLGFDLHSTTNLKPGAEDAFARYLAAILLHFRDLPDPTGRVAFNYVLPVNEPQWAWQTGQEGCRYANADLKRVFTALHRRFLAVGLNTVILGPESGSLPDLCALDQAATARWHANYGDYLNVLTGDPALDACFGGILTYHSYWSDAIPDELQPRRLELGRALARHPGWRLWQSEYCLMHPGRDLGMQAALSVARVIHCDLTLANASAWQWWLAVANGDYQDGLIYTDYHQPGDAETIHPAKLFWALGNYSRFIRPGMVRVELSGPQDLNGLLASAYLDPMTHHCVLVLVNNSATSQALHLRFARAQSAPVCFASHVTSATADLAPGPALLGRGSLALAVPARSLMTLVSTTAVR